MRDRGEIRVWIHKEDLLGDELLERNVLIHQLIRLNRNTACVLVEKTAERSRNVFIYLFLILINSSFSPFFIYTPITRTLIEMYA